MADTLIVACMKNEGPFILEWIAYHQSIGVSKFIIVTNDCTDGTDEILDRLDDMGIVRHLHNPTMLGLEGISIQMAAIKYAALQKEFRRAEYVLVIDADEFWNITTGDGTIPDLLERMGMPDAISFNQVVFGSQRVSEFLDSPVTSQFRERFRYEGRPPARYPSMYGVKTLFRNDRSLFRRFANHRPSLAQGKEDSVIWLDGSGRKVLPAFSSGNIRSYPVYSVKNPNGGGPRKIYEAFENVQDTHEEGMVNHYALRSLQSFVVQGLRGDAANPTVKRDFGYFHRLDRNEKFDDRILRLTGRMAPFLAALHADPVLKQFHRHAVNAHRAIYLKASRNPDIKDLIERCAAHQQQPEILERAEAESAQD